MQKGNVDNIRLEEQNVEKVGSALAKAKKQEIEYHHKYLWSVFSFGIGPCSLFQFLKNKSIHLKGDEFVTWRGDNISWRHIAAIYNGAMGFINLIRLRVTKLTLKQSIKSKNDMREIMENYIDEDIRDKEHEYISKAREKIKNNIEELKLNQKMFKKGLPDEEGKLEQYKEDLKKYDKADAVHHLLNLNEERFYSKSNDLISNILAFTGRTLCINGAIGRDFIGGRRKEIAIFNWKIPLEPLKGKYLLGECSWGTAAPILACAYIYRGMTSGLVGMLNEMAQQSYDQIRNKLLLDRIKEKYDEFKGEVGEYEKTLLKKARGITKTGCLVECEKLVVQLEEKIEEINKNFGENDSIKIIISEDERIALNKIGKGVLLNSEIEAIYSLAEKVQRASLAEPEGIEEKIKQSIEDIRQEYMEAKQNEDLLKIQEEYIKLDNKEKFIETYEGNIDFFEKCGSCIEAFLDTDRFSKDFIREIYDEKLEKIIDEEYRKGWLSKLFGTDSMLQNKKKAKNVLAEEIINVTRSAKTEQEIEVAMKLIEADLAGLAEIDGKEVYDEIFSLNDGDLSSAERYKRESEIRQKLIGQMELFNGAERAWNM